jgi:hypothetical protein
MGAGGGFSGASLDRHKTFYPPLSSVAGISKKPFTNKSSSSTLTIAVKLGGLTKQDRDSSSAADLPAFSSRTHGLTRTTPLRSLSLICLWLVTLHFRLLKGALLTSHDEMADHQQSQHVQSQIKNTHLPRL